MEQHPFVMFSARVEFSRALAQELRGGRGVGGELYYVWTLNGHYYPEDYKEIVWVLAPGDVRIPDYWDRSRIDGDLEQLARMVERLSLD